MPKFSWELPKTEDGGGPTGVKDVSPTFEGGGPAGVVDGLFRLARFELGVAGGVDDPGTRYIAR